MRTIINLVSDFMAFFGYVFLGWPVVEVDTNKILSKSFFWIITSWFISVWLLYAYYQAANFNAPKIVIAILIPILLIFFERGRVLSIVIKEKSLPKFLTVVAWCAIAAYAIYVAVAPEYLILFLAPVLFYLRSLSLIINHKILPISPKTNLKTFLITTLIFYLTFYTTLTFLFERQISLLIVSATFILVAYFIIIQSFFPKKSFDIDSLFYTTFHTLAIYILIYNLLWTIMKLTS